MRYEKPALSIDEQVARLKERGMRFDDEQRVAHYLTHIGYYRLSAYWLPFELPTADGDSRIHRFRPDTRFDQVLSLYIFDRRLRLLVMEAIERIEIAVRTHWAHALAIRHGAHAHLRSELFKCPWQHASDIARMAGDLRENRETFVIHYRNKYKEPYLPPIWAVVETLSLGALSRWFEATTDQDAKREVRLSLGMPTIGVLEKVLHALTPVRNVCAHHGRLWNRRFTLQLPLIKRLRNEMVIDEIPGSKKTASACDRCGIEIVKEQPTIQEQPSRRVFNYLMVMAHLMRHINPNSKWRLRLGDHIKTANPAQQEVMGFPKGWEKRDFWQKTPE